MNSEIDQAREDLYQIRKLYELQDSLLDTKYKDAEGNEASFEGLHRAISEEINKIKLDLVHISERYYEFFRNPQPE